MTSPTTEVFIFESTTAFENDPGKTLTPALKLVLAEDGAFSPVFYGKQIENPGKGIIFLNWESLEAHQKVIKSPTYKLIGEALAPSLRPNGKMEMFHVIFQGATVALEKPVTAVLVLSLKAPEHHAAVIETLNKLSDAGDQAIAFGQAIEDKNKYIIVGGSSSAEAHSAAEAAAKPEVTTAFDKLCSDLANKEHLFRVKLSQHAK